MPTYLYVCTNEEECGVTSEHFYRIADRPEERPCEICGARAVHRIAAPAVMQAAYPDGTRRFTDLKEANRLVREAAVSRKETAREIRREIRKLGVKVEQ